MLVSTDSLVKEDEQLLARRIKEELGDEYKENALVLRDQVNFLAHNFAKSKGFIRIYYFSAIMCLLNLQLICKICQQCICIIISL